MLTFQTPERNHGSGPLNMPISHVVDAVLESSLQGIKV